ncbi:PEP/pyruvate-binding domain-containing protein [Thiovibrio sp. JS02]
MPSSLLRRLRGLFAAGSDLAGRFALFKAVLAANNRTLEAMTEMGEKLGGDYLFDVNYTRRAYQELHGAISDSLANFARLTDNRYPALVETLNRIDTLVQRMLSGNGPASARLVVFYPEITWDLAEEVGGKNYHLAELANSLKLRVPEAFAVTTAAFSAFMRHNGLEERLAGLDGVDAAAIADLRAKILAGSFPEDFRTDLAAALDTMKKRLGPNATLAVRSSAEEEDGDFSFAGQFETVLNVPCTPAAVEAAYKEVVASLFQENAISYQRQLGYAPGRLMMAVGCLAMLDAKASGVIYTAAGGKDRSRLAISAAWGLGKGVVDGLTDADLYTVAKGEELTILERRIGAKAKMVVNLGEGTEIVATPANLRELACLNDGEILSLAAQAKAIEDHFRNPQDIEWALDKSGRCHLLQARALRMDGPEEETAPEERPATTGFPVLLENQGTVVQRGTTAGKVFVLQRLDELAKIPQGAILVASHDSPHFVQAIPFVNAIITEVGVPTSHMAAICREFAVPAVVNTGVATRLLRTGQEITLQAGEGGEFTIYAGLVQGLLRKERQTGARLRELYEFRRQKYIMRHIAPLNLVNPLRQDFSPEKCKTVHDLVRFVHEKSVQALVATAEHQGKSWVFGGRSALRRLALPLPVQLLMIDLGGGLEDSAGKEVGFAGIASLPLRAVLAGMLTPGVWQNESVPLQAGDLLAGLSRAADLTAAGGQAGFNLALASREYVNMSLRFGYHFNMLDSYCSDTPRNNHIYFRFVGGAAAIANRSRRIALMAMVLADHGFSLQEKGDLLVGRLSGLSRGEIEKILAGIGRLLAYTRQLDARLDSDGQVAVLARRFQAGDYRLDL